VNGSDIVQTTTGDQIVIKDGNQEIASARRRLIRGTFAVPAVLSLHCGSAMAMTSNLRCVYNQVTAGDPPSGSVVRTQLYGLRPSENSSEVRWYLRGSDIDGLRLNKSSIYNSFLQVGSWQRFDPDTGKLVDSAVVGVNPQWSNGNVGYLPTTPDGPYVAIRIDASLTEAGIVGVIDGSSPGSSVAGTCWTSFVTAAL